MTVQAVKSLIYLLARCTVALLVYLSVHFGTQLSKQASTASVLAFTCFGNVLLFIGYMLYFAGSTGYQALTNPQPRPNNVLLLSGEGDVLALRFQELVARCHAEATLVYERPVTGMLTTTVPLLWYHIYAVGFCFFTLSYCVHGVTLLPTLVLMTFSFACVIHYMLANPHPNGLSRVLVLLLQSSALGLLYVHSTAVTAESWLLCLVLPAACPVMLYNMQRDQVLQLSATQFLVFGLPCVTMMSVCFLSADLPIRELDLAELVRMSSNSTVEMMEVQPAAVLGCVVSPITLWLGMVAYADALLRPQRLLGVVGAFILVHAAKEAYMDPMRKEWQACVTLAGTAALLGIWLDPVPLALKTQHMDVRLQCDEEQEV
jgi:hypothetical protein